jgi:hypothetical protein
MASVAPESQPRSEKEIFDDLASLCASPGYIHAIAYFCFRDHIIAFGDTLRGEDYAKLFSFDRLIRTEISTLIGLMLRAPRDLKRPEETVLVGYLEHTESLLKELHKALNEPGKAAMIAAMADPSKSANPFTAAEVLREPIFYGAESAYPSQYRDLSVLKLPAQRVDATQALNLSAGVSNCKVSRGRSFS